MYQQRYDAPKGYNDRMRSICLITALPAEARPLISHFGLQARGHRHLRLYRGDFGYLLQCGVGKLNAAATTAAMMQSLPDVKAVINVGIAGCQQPIGQTLVAHGIQDQASSQQWFPNLPPVNRLPDTDSVKVLTVDRPADHYLPAVAFDMEASGIFNAASKVIDLAFIHSIKVISDNGESGAGVVTAKAATSLVESAIPTVEKMIQALPFDLLPDTAGVNIFSRSLIRHIHYTATEQHTLKLLLHRYNALYGQLPSNQTLQNLGSAKAIRNMLINEINNAGISY